MPARRTIRSVLGPHPRTRRPASRSRQCRSRTADRSVAGSPGSGDASSASLGRDDDGHRVDAAGPATVGPKYRLPGPTVNVARFAPRGNTQQLDPKQLSGLFPLMVLFILVSGLVT